jgi:hypothetical protein
MQNVLADPRARVSGRAGGDARVWPAPYDEGVESDGARAFARIATAVAKFWVCKRAPHLTYEAMECLGGNGYVEETIMPRLYRESPVNAIWEGSGNVICLDVLRAIAREPDSLPALLKELHRRTRRRRALRRHARASRGRAARSGGSGDAGAAPHGDDGGAVAGFAAAAPRTVVRRRTRFARAGSVSTRNTCSARCPRGLRVKEIVERAAPTAA